MTAIYGCWRWDEGNPDRPLSQLAAALSPLGTGRATVWRAHAVALGRRGFDLLPEDGHPTPVYVAGRRYAVVADAHLTERAALIESLAITAIDAAAMTDAALVASAIERWHERAFDRLYGAFAVAAWDCEQRRLLLARDHLGLRPLFYHVSADLAVVASMPEGIKAIDGMASAPDVEQYARLLRDLPLSAGETVHAGIKRVMPGHYCVIDTGGVTSARYWRPDLTPLDWTEQAAYEAALEQHLAAAVAAQLRGREPVIAAHLSAGFDSSTVVAFAAEQLASAGRRLVAYTAVPETSEYALVMDHHIADEGDIAAETAAMYDNIEHLRISAHGGALDRLDRAASLYPAPIRNLCNVGWSNAICDDARARGLRVLLEGSLGNISISDSGTSALPELLAAGRLRMWWRVARGLVRNGWMRWRGVIWNSIEPRIPRRWQDIGRKMSGRPIMTDRRMSILTDQEFASMTSRLHQEQLEADEYDVIEYDERSGPPLTNIRARLSALLIDHGGQLKSQLGEWGIDSRDPTADRRLIEFCLRIPIERLVWDGEPRAILRKVIEHRLPASVVHGRKRGLQAADWQARLLMSRAGLSDEIERIAMYDPLVDLIDIEKLKHLAETLPPKDSPLWQDAEVEADYRLIMLRTVSIAGHMRRTARSNY